jgi:DNA-binding NarL/FixJ family response regulator
VTTPAVLVCEDALGYRMLLCRLVEEAGGAIAGEASTWEEAERLSAELEPDAVIVDLWMPEVDTAALARIRERLPGARIVALSGLGPDEARDVVGETATSVDCFLSKRQPPAELVDVLRELLTGPTAPA